MIAGLEGAVEGYVLHLMLGSQVSGKSPLGDLLNNLAIEWGTFTHDYSINIIVLIAVGLAVFVSLCAPVLSIETSKYFMIFSIILQATMATGLWVLLFLGVGFLCLMIREWLTPYTDDSLSIAFVPRCYSNFLTFNASALEVFIFLSTTTFFFITALTPTQTLFYC